jgi:hypothetical protein
MLHKEHARFHFISLLFVSGQPAAMPGGDAADEGGQILHDRPVRPPTQGGGNHQEEPGQAYYQEERENIAIVRISWTFSSSFVVFLGKCTAKKEKDGGIFIMLLWTLSSSSWKILQPRKKRQRHFYTFMDILIIISFLAKRMT